jgi:hypothetical protein
MTVVTLHDLLARRDESMAAPKVRALALRRLARRIRRIDLAPAWRALVLAMIFISRHVLVLAGCAAIVISAAIVSSSLGWLAAGAALFFLEARRR